MSPGLEASRESTDAALTAEADDAFYKLVPEQYWELIDDLRGFANGLSTLDIDGLQLLHPITLDGHKLCVVKVDLIEKTIAAKGIPANPDATDEPQDGYFTDLVPDHSRELEEELASFARDMDALDKDELYGMLALALHEHRLSKAKVELVEERIRCYGHQKYTGKVALGLAQRADKINPVSYRSSLGRLLVRLVGKIRK